MRSLLSRMGLTAALLLAVSRAGAQDMKSLTDQHALDPRVAEAVSQVVSTGVVLHNGDGRRGIVGDPDACYHVYHGGLLALLPILDHRPDLQSTIKASLQRAQSSTRERRGFVLREALDQVQDAVRGRKIVRVSASLWDRLGGEAGVRRVVDDFVADVAIDPKVNFFRDNQYLARTDLTRLKQHFVEQISAATGGPLRYAGRDMKTVHAGMRIRDAEFEAVVGHLSNALQKNGASKEDAAAVLDAVNATRKEIVEGERRPVSVSPVVVPAAPEPGPTPVLTPPPSSPTLPTPKAPDPTPTPNLPSPSPTPTPPITQTSAPATPPLDMKIPTVPTPPDPAPPALAVPKLPDLPPPESAATRSTASPAPVVSPPAPEATGPKSNTLWDRLGGEASARRIVNEFLNEAVRDGKINFFRGMKYLSSTDMDKVKQHVVEQISAASGGPLKYNGRDMKTVHAGMSVSDEEFDALLEHLKTTLKKYKVNDDDIRALAAAIGGSRKDIVEKKEEKK